MRKAPFLLSLAFVGTLLSSLNAQQLYWLGTIGDSSSATGVSNDGLTVVGEANGNAVVWDRAADTIITVYNGSSLMSGCDATGAIAVGLVNPGYYSYQTPFMWTRQAGFQWLPPYPDFGWCADITPSGAYRRWQSSVAVWQQSGGGLGPDAEPARVPHLWLWDKRRGSVWRL
jgi:hypothetical protein